MRKPCCEKQYTNKGAWSKQEDQKLVDYIRKQGEGCWRTLPQAAGLLRCGKSCRLRWINYLRPDLKRGKFAEDEEELIIKLHALLGNRWSLIAGRLPGRTDNEVKNYWNSHLRRKLINMGVDPNNHRPTTLLLHRPHQNHHQNQPQQFPKSPANSAINNSNPQLLMTKSKNPRGHDDGQNCEQISDGTSWLEDDHHSPTLPDLNLALSISKVSSDNHLQRSILSSSNEISFGTSKCDVLATSTTLSLFR